MKCYLIAIGGTGARITRAFINMCAAGCFPTQLVNEFKIICIDSDGVGADLKDAETAFNRYEAMKNEGVFDVILSRPSGDTIIWSPLNNMRQSMGDMINYEEMSDAKAMYDFMFTEDERTTKLPGGFYGHTSIGSYFMPSNLTDDAGGFIGVWNDFFNNVQPTDRVFICGSLFGGTGASGLPTIARKIREVSKTRSVPIGALLMMPYFAAKAKPEDEGFIIDTGSFGAKSKLALDFYKNQNFDEIFDAMYFIGEDSDKFMNTLYGNGGERQRNKPNSIELYAATAIMDFLRMKPEVLTELRNGKEAKVKAIYRGSDNNSDILHPMNINYAGGKTGIYMRLMRMFRFSVMFTKYFYPKICAGKSDGAWLKKYRFNKYDEDQLKMAASFNEFCRAYINWILKMSLDTDETGITKRFKPNPYSRWVAICENGHDLYDGKALVLANGKLAKDYDILNWMDEKCNNVTTPGFKHIARGYMNDAKSAVEIYDEICENATKNGSFGTFVADVMKLC